MIEPIEPDYEEPCTICHGWAGYDCNCPECEVCGTHGDPACINIHMPWEKWPALCGETPAAKTAREQEDRAVFAWLAEEEALKIASQLPTCVSSI